MEGLFRINWPAIVEEAKQRRKTQKLTQQRLAELAGISTPTVSRFESGERDIQLSSAAKILGLLGMLDERVLVFSSEAHDDATRGVVRFEGEVGGETIICAISHEALKDHFNGDDKVLNVFRANRKRIEHEARRKYLTGRVESDGSVLLRTSDL